MSDRDGRMLLISGPSGTGKSTICRVLLEDPRVVFSISATTRGPRPGEQNDVDYHFLSTEEFRAKVDQGAFLEWAEVYGNLYGTLRAPMEEAIAKGLVYLLEIDVQGALQLKALEVDGIYVFVAPPDFETLRKRLADRGTETPEVLERRLKKAEDEYRERVKYDHVVINDDLDRTIHEVRTIAGLETSAGQESSPGSNA